MDAEWKHIERMEDMRLPKQVVRYRPQGRRDIGRPRKASVKGEQMYSLYLDMEKEKKIERQKYR